MHKTVRLHTIAATWHRSQCIHILGVTGLLAHLCQPTVLLTIRELIFCL